MKHLLLAAALVAIATSAVAQPPAPESPPGFNAGFCLGWQQAIAIEQARYANWRNQIVGETTPTTGVGMAVRIVAESVPMLVLLPPNVGGKFTLPDGRVIDCAAKPAGQAAPGSPQGAGGSGGATGGGPAVGPQ